MYDYEEGFAAIAAIMAFYILFIGLWWLGCAISGHALLSKKGYRHAGLYVMAWVPGLNWIFIFLFVGLPDALLNRKVDYLLRQMAANGLIQGQPAGQIITQPAYPQATGSNPAQTSGQITSPQFGQVNQPAQPGQPAQFGTQTASPSSPAPGEQPVWQPSQSQRVESPINPENLFGPGSKSNS